MTKITPPEMGDIDQVFKFMLECDIAEYGEPDSSIEDLTEMWKNIDLRQDAWLAWNKDHKLIGYASLESRSEGFGADIYLHLQHSPEGMEDQLADLLVARAKEIKTGGAEKRITAYATEANKRYQQVLERFGFVVRTFHYRMQIDFSSAVEPVVWPDWVTLYTYKDDDEMELFQFINTTMDWEGRRKSTIEDWRKLIFRGGNFDPQCFVLLRDGDSLVGAALGYADEEGGWVRQLAVSKDYQGKGLGGLLLRHMFHLFYQKGMITTALGVASTNEKAWQFYERNGMRRTRVFIEYQKLI